MNKQQQTALNMARFIKSQTLTLLEKLNELDAYSALFDHGLASKSDQRFASIRSTGNLTFSTAF
ncbi:Rop family plasmid primer RNA-binding protein [Escherichia coli]|nr:Rop family plasmid primer RNA-binding protein [Escherichia coli]